jgi:SRSO17 transposase
MSTATVPELSLTPADVADLADTLHSYHTLYAPLFPRSEQRVWAERYLLGLLSPLERKSVEPIVIAELGANESPIRGLQQFLTNSTWDDRPLLRGLWQEVASDLDDPEGMLIVDGSEFPKKGQHSVGVKRQYCGQLGKVANCQAGVFLAYASQHGASLLDRRLYLPREWLEDAAFAERRRKGRIPQEVSFQTKNALALEMIKELVVSQSLSCRWLLADEAYGRDSHFLDTVSALGLWYMVEVPLDTTIWTRPRSSDTSPKALASALPGKAWRQVTLGDGTKGRRIAEANVQRVLAKRDGAPGPEVWLVLRLDPESGELKAFLSNAPATLEPARMLSVSASRWPIEQCLEVAKQQLGMGHYEVRSWPGWHHHMTLVLLAQFFLVRLQRRLKKSPDAEPGPGPTHPQRLDTVAETNA